MAGLKLKLKLKQPEPKTNGSESSPSPRTVVDSSSKPPALPRIKIKAPKRTEEIGEPQPKKLRINFKNSGSNSSNTIVIDGTKKKKVPRVRVKPQRVAGEGYDSEAPDLEDDPLIERGIIIRFLDDANLDSVHSAVESNELAGINVEWIAKNRAIVHIHESSYSAVLLDLPTVSEIFKTIDKKNIYKIMDICEILLVVKIVNPRDLNESDFEIPKEKLYKHPLYKVSPDKEIHASRKVYKDGLTRPFEDVYRRFKPRKLNHRVMEDIDSRVDELIRLDNESVESHFEVIDPNRQQFTGAARFQSPSPPPQNQAQFPQTQAHAEPVQLVSQDLIDQDLIDFDQNSDLEEELAKALENNGLAQDGETIEGVAQTPGEDEEEVDEEDEDDGLAVDNDEDEDEDDEDEDEDDEEDYDDETRVDKQRVTLLEEEISELEKAVEINRNGLMKATVRMMKMKFQNSYNTLKASLDSKKRELARITEEANTAKSGEVDDDEDNENDGEENDDNEGEENEDAEENEVNEQNQQQQNDDEEDVEGFDDLDDLF